MHPRFLPLARTLPWAAAALVSACAPDVAGPAGASDSGDTRTAATPTCTMPTGVGPGASATDVRAPELTDLGLLDDAKVTLGDALADAEARDGIAIEAMFELSDDDARLRIRAVGAPAALDAERSVFHAFAGDATVAPLDGQISGVGDATPLLRSARELTLVQLSGRSLRDAVSEAEADGIVFWAAPTIRDGKPGYGVYTRSDDRRAPDERVPAASNCVVRYRFIDGLSSQVRRVTDLGDGPGDHATDARVPELGSDLRILETARVTLTEAIAYAAAQVGPAIEAKFERDDAGHLSVSVYPIGDSLALDAARNTFGELAGDPTALPFAPTFASFTMPDRAHLMRAARDLTLVQTASLDLATAVTAAQNASPGGIVFWAVPTIRTERAGYGIYVYAADRTVHYYFVS